MKAIRIHEFGGPDVMRVEDVPDPTPGPGQVLVRVAAAGVNPVDTYIRAGTYAARPDLPYTPGCDAAGTVEAVGAGVRELKAGDRVYVSGTSAGRYFGTYAERLVCKPSQAHLLADEVTFAQGAAIGVPFATAYRALFQRTDARAGETVLIHGGSGGVGTAAVQFARARGLTVIATAGTPEGERLVRDLGAHHVVNHRDADYLDRIPALTGGRGVDLIVEMLANVNLDRDLGLLAPRGRVVVVGNRGRVEIDPRQTMGKDSSIIGMVLPNATEDDLREIHAAIVAGLTNGTLKPIAGRELPLAEAPRAHELVMQPGAYGKIVLVP